MGISLDGIVAILRGDGSVPVMEGEWGLPPEDPELTKLKLGWVREAGAHLMGRVTYEAMAGYWPTSTHDYAAPMNEIPKVVFSTRSTELIGAILRSPAATSWSRSPGSGANPETTSSPTAAPHLFNHSPEMTW